MSDPYYSTRYTFDPNRTIVWQEIVRFLKPYLVGSERVLDLGAGYCDFINNIEAKKKMAVDFSPDFSQYAKPEVETIISPVTRLEGVAPDSVDLCFASNLLEHLTDLELEMTMTEIKRVLKSNGQLILMQPNYRLNPKHYFDDPTHKKIFSDDSLQSFLSANGFQITKKWPRFLPFSLKTKPGLIPVSHLLVRLYLNLPWKPLAGQMLFIAKIKK